MADITLTQAQQAVDAALNKAKEMGVRVFWGKWISRW